MELVIRAWFSFIGQLSTECANFQLVHGKMVIIFVICAKFPLVHDKM